MWKSSFSSAGVSARITTSSRFMSRVDARQMQTFGERVTKCVPQRRKIEHVSFAHRMKRYAPWIALVLGLAGLALLLPRFDAAQPKGVRFTRPEAHTIADAQARGIGIPVDKTWSNITWTDSDIIAKELEH